MVMGRMMAGTEPNVRMDSTPGITWNERQRKEAQTKVMQEEIDIIRDQVNKLRPDLGRQNSLLSAGYSVAIACLLQLAGFMASGIDIRKPSWGTFATLAILLSSIVAIVYAKICKMDGDDAFEDQKDSILSILDRIFPETKRPTDPLSRSLSERVALPPARRWWQRLFRKLCGI